jgi:hypothetical protein
MLTAGVRKYRIEMSDLIPKEERMNWAFGFCGMTKYKGAPFNHTVCFCITVMLKSMTKVGEHQKRMIKFTQYLCKE